ncbi:hypothetical protein [Tengunoibacter tsumagoiensis]|nr:hypothetical protein [Tengunoibacter tsumagoiensis]
MSTRTLVTISVVLLLGIVLGVGFMFVAQNLHIFAAPTAAPKPSMHW